MNNIEIHKRLKKMMDEQQDQILSSTRRKEPNRGGENTRDIVNTMGNLDLTVIHPTDRPPVTDTGQSFGNSRTLIDQDQDDSTDQPRLHTIEETDSEQNTACALPLSSVLEKIQTDVDNFQINMMQKDNWHQVIESEFNDLSNELSQFQMRCLTEFNYDLVTKAEDLNLKLKDYCDELRKKAVEEAEANRRQILTQPRLDLENRQQSEEITDPTVDTSLERQHGLITSVQNLTISESHVFRIDNYRDHIKRLPDALESLDKILHLEKIDDHLDIIEKFQDSFRGNSAKSILDKMGELNAHLENTDKKIDIQIKRVNEKCDKLQGEMTKLKEDNKQMNVSLKVAIRLASSNSNFSTNPSGNILRPSPVFLTEQSTLPQDRVNPAQDREQIHSCPSSPIRNNNGARNLEEEMRTAGLILNRSESYQSIASTGSISKVHERRLKRIMTDLKDLISEDLTRSTLSDEVIIDLHSNVMADVIRLSKECDDKCESYAKTSDHNEELIDKAGEMSASGYSWTTELKRLYRERQLHLHTKSNTALTGSLNLQLFAGDSSQTVYEFFKRFDQFTKANYTSEQKAILLYSSYLSERIKQELVPISGDFSAMKEWLLKKFGNIKSIVDCKLTSLKDKKQPSTSSTNAQKADYYRQVYSILAGIQSLPQTSEIDIQELALCIYTNDFIIRILQCLPQQLIDLYRNSLRLEGIDTEYFQGKKPFDILMKQLQIQYSNMDFNNRISGSRENNQSLREKNSELYREKQAQHLNTNESSFENNDHPNNSVHYQAKEQKSPDKGNWYDPNMASPCPIINHKHEVGSCQEFFKKSSKSRKTVCFRKVCYCCLGPRNKCRESCQNVNKMPPRLICQDYIPKAKNIGKSPFNILICTNKDHSRPNTSDILSDCEKWFPSFSAKSMHSSLYTSINLVAFTSNCRSCKNKNSCTCTAPSLSSPVDPDSEPPIVNTFTGESVDVDETDIVRESHEESFYLMQIIDLRGQECLCFFDRGANQHLIEGDLAEKANLKVLDPRSSPIGVVGGSRIWTQYGMYSVILGPTIEGKYHELKCQGIKSITNTFPKYDLQDIGRTVRQSGVIDPDLVLPKYIGGSRAQLLLGIKDVHLDPVTLTILPNGLGVYQSQIKDIFGSRICYGGPHSLFSEVNKKTGGDFNHINIFLTEMVTSYRNSLYPILASCSELAFEDDKNIPVTHPKVSKNIYCIEAHSDPRIDIYPTPLSADDTKLFDIVDSEEPDNEPNLVNMIGMDSDYLDTCMDHSSEKIASHHSEDSADFKNMSRMDSNTSETGMNHCSVNNSCSPTRIKSPLILGEGSMSTKNMICRVSDQSETGMHYCSVYKAKIPLDKLVKMVDDDDISNLVNYRCPTCSKCVKCLESNKTKTMSLQESFDQDLIHKSVILDFPNRKAWIYLPFTKDPIKFLKKFHKDKSSNYYQAIAAYRSQCKKTDLVKDGIRKAHAELVSKGFIVKLSELSDQAKALIRLSLFMHYYVWGSVVKDSPSTPVRLVVDPSRTGLNLILAKGENNMAKIVEILLRSRCKRYVFATDISKLYNQLHLMQEHYNYQLMLYDPELDTNKDPDTWVLVVGWYGVISTGNQSGDALDQTADARATQFPLGSKTVKTNRYVDDIKDGSNSHQVREQMILETQQMLELTGFKLKFVARSGEPPPAGASTDGESIKVLGYKYKTEVDTLCPGFEELNFNPKKRGAKKPNDFPVTSADDVDRLLQSTKISRRKVVAKMAEIHDPLGLWEPYKLQLKLDVSFLNGMDWDTELPPELEEHWQKRFTEFLDLPSMQINRCVVPPEAVDPDKLRLLCLSDAAAQAGGAAIYASYLLKDGSYSCQLLISKSKLMDMSIPRNELSAILLMSELAFLAKKALGSIIQDILYFTDSTIALSWSHNTTKKLRMFVHNRVTTIRRFMFWTVGESESLPLFHIDGNENIADLLTKVHNVVPSSLGPNSEWHTGKPWMRLNKTDLLIHKKVTTYASLTHSEVDSKEITKECFIEPSQFPMPSLSVNTLNTSPEINFRTELDQGEDPVTNEFLKCSSSQTNFRTELDQGVDPVTNEFLECPKDKSKHCEGCSQPHLGNHTRFPQMVCFGTDESGHCDGCNCITDQQRSVLMARKNKIHQDLLLPVISLGWKKTVACTTIVVKYCHLFIHTRHNNSKNVQIAEKLKSICRVCKYVEATNTQSNSNLTRSKEKTFALEFKTKPNLWLGEDYLFRHASKELLLSESKSTLESFTLNEGIYLYTGRLAEEFPVVSVDLDINDFFDNTEFKTITPVVLSSSQVFYAYLIYVHDHVRKHSGVELTLREILKKMHVINNPRRVISKVRNDCVKCRIMFKKTLELEMASQAAGRTVLSPPFHSVQIDIAYKFKGKAWKNARQVFDIYALVIVCILSSATSIVAIEGLETGDVVQALERHGSRFGMPANVFVDAGSQLVALQSARFSLRDVDLIVHDSVGMNVRVSSPKSHEERGRVEAKVKTIRAMLTKLSVNTNDAITALSWETVFAKIANELDNIPICKGNSSNVKDFGFDIITPNRYKLGRNNHRSLNDSITTSCKTYTEVLGICRKYQRLWIQLMLDRLHHFMPKPKKWSKTDPVSEGDIVIFIHKDSGHEKMFSWELGKIIGIDDTLRRVEIEYFGPGKKRKLSVTRCPRQVSKIYDAQDLPVDTVDYYKQNIQNW